MNENTQSQSTNNQMVSKPSMNTQQSQSKSSQAIYQNLPPIDKTYSTNMVDTNKNSSSKKNALKTATIYILILLCFIVISFFISRTFLTNHSSTNVGQKSTSPMGLTEGTTPKAIPTVTIDPTKYGTADVTGITIKVDKTITNPPTQGDPPDNGRQYLEIDLAVIYTGNIIGSVPGFFYYRTGSGSEITPADVKVRGLYSNKNVHIPGKQSFYAVDLIPGKTQEAYLLFQIQPGDHGKLIWYIPNAQNTNSQQVIYNLQ